VRQARRAGDETAAERVIIQINQVGQEGKLQELGLRRIKVRRDWADAEHRAGAGRVNVRANAVCPGDLLDSPLWVDSLYRQYAKRWGITEEEVRQKYIDQVPMKRGCTYEDVCNVVVFLASDQASYMTGQAVNVPGGGQEMRWSGHTAALVIVAG
jgi:sorbitol-6-phosphate 2-dehydrogenase